MQITLTKKGRIRIKPGKFTYQHKVTLGDVLVLGLLGAWFLFDVLIWLF